MYSFGHYLTIQNGVASFLQIVQIELFALEAFTYSKKKLFFSNVHVWALLSLAVLSPVLPTYTHVHTQLPAATRLSLHMEVLSTYEFLP